MSRDRTFRRSYIYVAFFGIVALLATLLISFHHSYDEEVVVASPTIQDIESTASTNGVVVPANDFKARANFSGTVDDITVHPGELVHAGQLLVRLRDPFAAARVASASVALQGAELASENIEHNGTQEDRVGFTESLTHAQSEQSAALRDLDLLKKLQQDGSASTAEVVAAQRRLTDANAVIEALHDRSTNRYAPTERANAAGRVSEARMQLSAERANEANSNITSPISGTVYLVPIAKYDFVQTGANLVDVADLSRVEVHASFDEPDIGRLNPGQAVRIFWNGRPNRIWHGHLTRPPLAVTATGSRSVGDSVITVDDAHSDLPADTNVTVIVTLQTRAGVLTIPREAIHTAGGTDFVFRVVDEKLVRTPVTLGIVDLSRVQVAGGLGTKDVIALHTADDREMSNAMTVKVLK